MHHHDGERHPFHVVLGVCTHGDEVGPLPAALRLLHALRAGRCAYGGRLSLVVMNPDAARAGQRFLDSDLNRVFVADPPPDREGQRARALQPLLDGADLFLDLHQTATPTASAFWTLPWRAVDDAWVQALGAAPLWLTRPAGQVFSAGTCCADEYVRARGRPGLTLELSARGLDPATEAAAWAVMVRALALADALAAGHPLPDGPVTCLATAWVQPFSSPALRLRDGLSNLQPVAAGEPLEAPGTPPLRSPVDGFLAFPKYPPRDARGLATGPLPGELVRVAAPLSVHPRDLWGG